MKTISSLSFTGVVLAGCCSLASAQSIGTFQSVAPGSQVQTLVLPSTHTFQKIISSGATLSGGGTLGNNLDFTGYVPIGGSSTNGYLSISSETTPAEVSVLDVSFNSSSQLWNVSAGQKVPFPSADLGGTSRFCSGTVTPDNTIMVCEESTTAGDANGDGYEDAGWVIEIDPVTKTVKDQDANSTADKLWAVGRQSHENVAIKSDESVIFWGADANPTGYMYKFIPAVPGVWTSGTLYVLVTTSGLGTGTWVQVPNSTQAERNATVTNSTALGAYNFNGIEDVEFGPDGKMYFAAKGPGRVYRFTDAGASVTGLEVFVESTNYDVDGAGPFSPTAWGIGNDNLAFDSEGNLWVLQDGSNNHIWVVGPTHTAASPAVRLFATTPAGSEPTGITFSPDYKFLFMSFQHPTTSNTASQTDAAGNSVVFNTHTTIVIARRENLGACNAPTGLSASSITTSSATVSWASVPGALSYDADYKLSSSGTWTNAATGTTSLSVNLAGLSSGTLYNWRVRANCGTASSAYSQSSFTTASPPCPGPYDVSSNNTVAGAATIPLNEDIKGTIYPTGDKDYYHFSVTTSGTVTITLTTLPANYNLELRNSANTLLASSSNNGTANETINYSAAAGTAYYAVAVPKGNVKHQTLCYTLRVAAAGLKTVQPPVFTAEDVSMKAWPVPVGDVLFLEIPKFESSATISIYNLAGQQQLSEKVTTSSPEINVSSLSSGIYFVRVYAEGEVFSLKFMKAE